MTTFMTSLLRHAPNALTGARAAGGLIGAGLLLRSAASSTEEEALAYGLAAALIYLAAAITDWLDGWAARALKVESALGALLDPVADKILTGAYLAAYVVITRFDPWLSAPVFVIIARDAVVTILRLATAKPAVLHVSAEAKMKTAATMIVTGLPFVFFAAGLHDPGLWYHVWVGGVWFAALLSAWTGWPYIRSALGR